MTKKTIYFICTGNSCRSQMAEGWAKQILADDWNVYSVVLNTRCSVQSDRSYERSRH